MRQNNRKERILLLLLGIIPVVWIGLLVAPYAKGGLPEILRNFGKIMNQPFFIEICEDSLKTVLIFLLLYGLTAAVILSSGRNYRKREEHGSAKWGSAAVLNKKYADKDKMENKILTQNVSSSLNTRKHLRNLNVLVCGGSGAGKTRMYVKPQVLQANASLFILDPKIAVF